MRWAWAIFLLVGVCSCGPSPLFSETLDTSPQGWTTAEELTYEIEVEAVDQQYELQLLIDHSTEYRYQNIYFKIKTGFPDRDAKEEQLSVDLATKSGEWLGDCSAAKCKTKVYLLDNFKFPTAGTYTFEISQYTREENLKGINSLELSLFQKTK